MDTFPFVDQEPAPEWYGRLRVETEDLGPAHWLTERRPGYGDFGTVAGVAAPGFPAYARVLHPAGLDERPVRWDTVAAAYGRRVGSLTGWHEVIGAEPHHYQNEQEYGLAGVWDEHPDEGPTPVEVARALIPVLARHTGTPERCWYGLWDGYGSWDWRGLPTFPTPGRDEILLSGPLADAASPGNLDMFAELPDLWWPEDRRWCVGGDVDLVSTYVCGSGELVADLLAAPGLEVHRVTAVDRVG
ncbi:hypothetical protein GPZ77_30915 [Streptomyces sp. QHH-9511]|uniref:hypothetical protein n=1 Tax=Streptomyces sp. QHH-9511 TaxID=2684468 RepID=UPI001318BF7E|nr:hypothetical protein [Streptomyces sp. QHH-9511]QGZ52183.1 hypothetical protein GPZ77_30915 [Streptomyces sp. QHH-9511]